ncbi:MAG: hypothetical protein KAX49_10845 [Halanaerobiales bacterium]|nr:hypothetical protein [Halanaerobiales bacterium]
MRTSRKLNRDLIGNRATRRNRYRSIEGMIKMKKLHDMETAGVIEHIDSHYMNEALADPKQSLPRPRSDLPKNNCHEPKV